MAVKDKTRYFEKNSGSSDRCRKQAKAEVDRRCLDKLLASGGMMVSLKIRDAELVDKIKEYHQKNPHLKSKSALIQDILYKAFEVDVE